MPLQSTQMAMAIELQDVQQEEEEGEEQGGREKNEQENKRSKKSVYLYYLGLVVVVIGFASCVMQLQFHGTYGSLLLKWA